MILLSTHGYKSRCISPYYILQITLLADFDQVTGAEKEDKAWMEKFGEWIHVNQISNWKEEGQAEWTVAVFEPDYYYLDLSLKNKSYRNDFIQNRIIIHFSIIGFRMLRKSGFR